MHPNILYDWLHNLRGKSRGSVCVLRLTQPRYKQPVKIYKYILYNFNFFYLCFSWWVILIHLVFQLRGPSLLGSVAELLSWG